MTKKQPKSVADACRKEEKDNGKTANYTKIDF